MGAVQDSEDVVVRDAPESHRFEIFVEDELAGFTVYRSRGENRFAFSHTEVDSSFGGRGLGGILVRGALDAMAERGAAVLPYCPYVRRVIARNAEKYLDLVPVDVREDFDLPAAA